MAIPPSLSDVTVVSVCYNSGAMAAEMVATVPNDTPIVLVDNGRTNDFSLLPPHEKTTIVLLDENLGFGRGCNAGAAVVQTPWILFLNPDARLYPGAIEALLAAATKYQSAIAFNPRISNSDGSEYFKRRSWLLPRSQYLKKGWPKADAVVPVLTGAAFFTSKTHFDEIGGFDPNIFLFHEDDDLSMRLATLGKLMFVHGSHVVHAAGHSSGRSTDIARLKAFHMAQSRIYTGFKHNKRFVKASTILQAAALLASPYVLFSARRRAKAAGFLAGVISKLGDSTTN